MHWEQRPPPPPEGLTRSREVTAVNQGVWKKQVSVKARVGQEGQGREGHSKASRKWRGSQGNEGLFKQDVTTLAIK